MDHIVIASPPLVVAHPRLPGVEVWRAPRTGSCVVVVTSQSFTPSQVVDLGEWLAEQGREHDGHSGCLNP